MVVALFVVLEMIFGPGRLKAHEIPVALAAKEKTLLRGCAVLTAILEIWFYELFVSFSSCPYVAAKGRQPV